jgi:soluble lytic murein transglycosylase-like protein
MADKGIFAADMGAPVAAADMGAARSMTEHAGALYQSSNATLGQALGGAVQFAGTQAVAGAKGFLEAGIDKEVDQVIAAVPASAAAAQQAITAGGPNPAGEFGNQVDRLYAAYHQGVLSASDVKLRVDKIVREYSAKAPGWASDFRRRASERVGMSGVSEVLAGQARANEQAKADWEFALKQDQKIMETLGLQTRDQITPEMRRTARGAAQAEFVLKNAQTARATAVLTEEENAKVAAQEFAAGQAMVLAGAQVHYQQFVQANEGLDLSSKQAADKYRNDLTKYLTTAETRRMIEIDRMMDPRLAHPISYAQAKAFKEDAQKQFNMIRENLKTDEGSSLYLQALKDTKGVAEDLQHRLSIANPTIMVYKEGGNLPEMVRQYIALGRDKEQFAKAWGTEVATAMDKWMNNPFGAEAFSKADMAVRDGRSSLAAVASTMGPDAANTMYTQANGQIAAGKGTEADLRVWFGDNGENLNLGSSKGRQALDAVLKNGGLEKSLKALDPVVAEKWATAMYTQAEQAQAGAVRILADLERKIGGAVVVDSRGRVSSSSRDQSVQAAIRDYNNNLMLQETTAKYLETPPDTVELRRKPYTMLADIRKQEAAKATKTYESEVGLSAEAAAAAEATGLPGENRLAPAEQAKAAADERAAEAARGVGRIGGPTTPAAIEAEAAKPRASVAPAGVPKHLAAHVEGALQQNPNVRPELVAKVIEAESGGDVKAVSPKGAVGPMQLMPKTAADLGVDPHDPKQNIEGGVSYLSKLLNLFNGDEVKALAAYNWGVGNVLRKGVEKAPKETRDYIRKILGGHGGGGGGAGTAPATPSMPSSTTGVRG